MENYECCSHLPDCQILSALNEHYHYHEWPFVDLGECLSIHVMFSLKQLTESEIMDYHHGVDGKLTKINIHEVKPTMKLR